jgi:hypothetical protein
MMPRHDRAARLVASLCAAALLSSIAPASLAQAPGAVVVSEAAKRHFQAGVDFLKDPDGARYEEALREFRTAYADSPSWKILGNLALCAMKLERNGEAIETYQRYVTEAGSELDAAEKAQIEKDVRLMRSSSATLVLIAKGASGDVTVIDQRARSNGSLAVNTYTLAAGKPLKLVVQSGHHVFKARAGGKELRWEDDLAAEKQLEHAFGFDGASQAGDGKATDEPQGMTTLRLVGIGTAGVGGALLIGGVITGVLGKGKLDDLKAGCINNQCARDKKSEADSVESLQTTTNVLLVAGGVLAAAGITMIVVGKQESPGASSSGSPGSSSRPRLARPPSFALSPSIGPGGAGLWATGSF